MVESIIKSFDISKDAQEVKFKGRLRSVDNISFEGIAHLRKLILELAIQGKLTSQNQVTESINDAENINNSNRLKSSQLIKEAQIPFKLPTGWTWSRLGDVIDFIGGSQPPKSKFIYEEKEGYVRLVQIRDFRSDEFKTYVPVEYANRLFYQDDIMIGRYGPPVFQILRGLAGTYNVALMKATPNQFFLSKDYCFHLLQEPRIQKIIVDDSERTAGQSGVRKPLLESIVFALPPPDEQHRIVAKVDQLMALCDKLEQQKKASLKTHQLLVKCLLQTLTAAKDAGEVEAAWYRLAPHFDTLFCTEDSIEQLKQTILQLAVMGRLVKQDPTNEPASELVKKIENEKEKLLKDGKIKREKPLPEIREEEKPFALPSGWDWVRGDQVSTFIDPQPSHRTPPAVLNGIPYIGMTEVREDGTIDFDNARKVSVEVFKEHKNRYTLEDGDFIIGKIGTIGEPAFLPKPFDYTLSANIILVQPFKKFIYPRFITFYLQSPIALDLLRSQSTTSTHLVFGIKKSRMLLFPLPPFAEQQRIINKVEELMSLCDTLKERLLKSQEIQNTLSQTIVENAVA